MLWKVGVSAMLVLMAGCGHVSGRTSPDDAGPITSDASRDAEYDALADTRRDAPLPDGGGPVRDGTIDAINPPIEAGGPTSDASRDGQVLPVEEGADAASDGSILPPPDGGRDAGPDVSVTWDSVKWDQATWN